MTTLEVQGTWLENGGARQLLEATVRELRERAPGVRIAIDPRWGPYDLHRHLGLLRILPRRLPMQPLADAMVAAGRKVSGPAGRRALETRGWVTRSDIDGMVDVSGFALSDEWGAEKARDRWSVAQSYVRRKRPVVLLPQSMGPFDDPGVAASVRPLLTSARAVWVRDDDSLRHVRRLVGSLPTVRRAPDITVAESTPSFTGTPTGVFVVPNARLADRGRWPISDLLDWYANAVCAAQASGRTVSVLLHTTENGDVDLAGRLASRCGIAIVREDDAFRLKERIAASELVIGSRFHALLGALSSGVPAIILGWSHKYDELAREFGVDDLVVTGRDCGAAASLVERALCDYESRRARLACRAHEIAAEVDSMWHHTMAALGLR